ncbi:MAG: LytTR family DNA-binding domain-containing protein [Ferruginibacter sp.]
MEKQNEILINNNKFDYYTSEPAAYDNLQSQNNREIQGEARVLPIISELPVKNCAVNLLVNRNDSKITKENSDFLLRNNPETKTSVTSYQNTTNLFRLFVKNGEYVYARPNDIIMIESCDHMVKVYLASNDKIKKTIRHNTLKDFLLQLPQDQFMRIGRFCAINILRLTGGNCNEQTFEFDFKVSVKLKHAISNTAFTTIGK